VTALVFACDCGEKAVVRALIENGAELNTEWHTPLLNAVCSRDSSTVEYLMQLGVTLATAEDVSYRVYSGNHLTIVDETARRSSRHSLSKWGFEDY
jgi:hypothetical protein